jgi:glc operon protein GlcG
MRDRLDRRAFARLAAGAAGATALVPGLAATAAARQPVPTAAAKQTVTQAAADALLDAAEAKARELGVNVAIAIVDEGGLLKAFRRMDDQNSAGTVDAVQAKAYTAAAFRAPTHVFAERNADPARLASFASLPRVTLLGGGYPIQAGDAVVGGIGVGGGSPQQDQQIAEAALAALAGSG